MISVLQQSFTAMIMKVIWKVETAVPGMTSPMLVIRMTMQKEKKKKTTTTMS